MSDTQTRITEALRPNGLGRRSLLTAALAGAGAVALGSSLAQAGNANRSTDIEVTQPGAPHARWVRLELRPDGSGDAVPLTITTDPHTESTVTVATSTGLVSLSARTEGDDAAKRVELAAAAGTGTVWVTPRRVGSPGVPADRLVIECGGEREEVDVWVEPVGGTWAGRPGSSLPLELGIVAIHAAMLKRGDDSEVVMYSLARERDPWDADVKVPDPDHPGQYKWDIYKMDDMEGRALTLPGFEVVDRQMAHPKNIFCGGQAQLPDGRLLHVGGHFTKSDKVHNADLLHLYDPGQPDPHKAWTAVKYQMDPARWYPTVTALPDGRMLITSGSTTLPKQNLDDYLKTGYWNSINNSYLIFDPATGTVIDPKAGDPTADLIDQAALTAVNEKFTTDNPNLTGLDLLENYQQLATYPSVFTLPGASAAQSVVAIAESNRAWLYRYQEGLLKRTETMYPMQTKGSRSYPHYGAMVLLPLRSGEKPRILAVGGQFEGMTAHRRLEGASADTTPSTDTAEIFEVDTVGVTGTWKPGGRMAHQRVLCDATLLADGQVLVSGGSQWGWGDLNGGEVFESELFDPKAAEPGFTRAAVAATSRRYHSVALLLPDGSLLKAGSTGGFGSYVDGTTDRMVVDTTGELYHPGYLYRGPRPLIKSVTPAGGADAPLKHGQPFVANIAGPVMNERARLALIRPGSTTHGNNMDQRFVWLDGVVTPNGGTWDVAATVPAGGGMVPPGVYMLVAVSEDGIPTEATWVGIAVG